MSSPGYTAHTVRLDIGHSLPCFRKPTCWSIDFALPANIGQNSVGVDQREIVVDDHTANQEEMLAKS
jgi:hypothetical protein